jgi:hypothetical protein
MRRLLTVLFYGLVAACAPTWAEFHTGNKVKAGLEDWEKKSYGFEANYNAGYVIGVFDAYYRVRVCSPENVTVGQVTSVVLKYMQEHPDVLHLSGDVVVLRALLNSWPCETQSNPPASKTAPRPRSPSKGGKSGREESPF